MNVRQLAARIDPGLETLHPGRLARTLQLQGGRRNVFADHLERARWQTALTSVAAGVPKSSSQPAFQSSLQAAAARRPAEPSEPAVPGGETAPPASAPDAAAPQEPPAPVTPAPLRESHNGPIGLNNPAMDAYYAFDPAGFGSFEAAVSAANDMLEADQAAYGDQMAARMLSVRGGKAYQYWHAQDAQQTAGGAFGSITNPWVTAYNGGIQRDVQQDLVDGYLQWSDIPEQVQGRLYHGLRLQLASTGAYNGRIMPADVEDILHSLRFQQNRQAHTEMAA